MADANTPNYNLVKPEVGLSRDTWGNKTNSNWDIVDPVMKANEDAAAAAQAKADTNENDIAQLELDVEANSAAIATNTTDISNNAAAIAQNTSDIAANTAAIDNLPTQADNDNRYVNEDGDVMSGPLTLPSFTVTGAVAETFYENTAAEVDEGKWNVRATTDGRFIVRPVDDALDLLDGLFDITRDAAGVLDARLIVQGSDDTVPAADSLLTKRRADGLYGGFTQGGQGTSATGSGSVTFPTPFPNDNVSVVATAIDTNDRIVVVSNVTATGFNYNRRESSTGDNIAGDFTWIAVAY